MKKNMRYSRRDFIFEMDYVIGELLKTLERLGVADNTLVMLPAITGRKFPRF